MNPVLKVNGIRITCDVQDNVRLIDFLREELKLTGTKEGCSVGECGACTVIMDGKSVCACLLLAAQCNGRRSPLSKRCITIRWVKNCRTPLFVTAAFSAVSAPGVMSAKALLDANPAPSDDELKEALEGNICRCTDISRSLPIKAVLKS
jgi:carbon-monoxide dehydrogenase small subunit